MKLLLLHGPGIEVSRKKLISIKKKFDTNNIVVFDPSAGSTSSSALSSLPKGSPQASLGQVMASLHTVSMFDTERLIIWENPPEDILRDIPYTLYPIPYTLILWFDHEVDPKKFPADQVLFFPEGKEISAFPFLDMLASKDKNAFLELNKLKKGGFETQYIITMIFYLLRSFIYIPSKSPEFVKKKVARQRANFSLEDIKNFYKFIIETDFKIKKGLMEAEQAEFLLLTKFCNLG